MRERLDHAVAIARGRGAQQSFRVEVEVALPFLSADPNLIDQVVANILGNATRYAGPTAHIMLAARREVNCIAICVTDDGPGIPADVLPRVFDKFVRAPRAGDAGEGTGLGLAIAKGIVEAHQGVIAVESPDANGRGTRVTARLPLQGWPP